MRDVIMKLEKCLQAHRPDYFAELAAGVSNKEVRALEATVNRQLPKELAALYR